MDTFIHQNGLSVIEKEGKRLEGFMKPDFSFYYDEIQFHETSKGYVLNGHWTGFTAEQQQELVAYIEGQQEDAEALTNLESQMYLADTDWYAIRKFETGVTIPQEILTKRQEAREAIVQG